MNAEIIQKLNALKNDSTTWDFIESFYPNYYQCSNISKSDILQKLVDEDFEENAEDSAHTYLKEVYNTSKLSQVIEFIKTDLVETNENIYMMAIDNFIKELTK